MGIIDSYNKGMKIVKEREEFCKRFGVYVNPLTDDWDAIDRILTEFEKGKIYGVWVLDWNVMYVKEYIEDFFQKCNITIMINPKMNGNCFYWRILNVNVTDPIPTLVTEETILEKRVYDLEQAILYAPGGNEFLKAQTEFELYACESKP